MLAPPPARRPAASAHPPRQFCGSAHLPRRRRFRRRHPQGSPRCAGRFRGGQGAIQRHRLTQKKQPFGEHAKQPMSDLVHMKDIDLDCIKTDRYGRSVCNVMGAPASAERAEDARRGPCHGHARHGLVESGPLARADRAREWPVRICRSQGPGLERRPVG